MGGTESLNNADSIIDGNLFSSEGQKQTETDRNRQKQKETDRNGQNQTEGAEENL